MKLSSLGLHKKASVDLVWSDRTRAGWAMIDVIDVGFYRIEGEISLVWSTHIRVTLDKRIGKS